MHTNGNHAVHILDTLQLNLYPRSFSNRLRRKRTGNSTKEIHQWVVVIDSWYVTSMCLWNDSMQLYTNFDQCLQCNAGRITKTLYV